MNSTDLKSQLRELYISGAKVLNIFLGWCLPCKTFIKKPFNFLAFLTFKTTYLYRGTKIIPFQEIDVSGKKAIVISVPVPQIRAFQKIQVRKVSNQKLLKMRKWVIRILVPNIPVLAFGNVLVFLTVVITLLQVVVCHCDRTEWNSIQRVIIRKGQLRLCIYMYMYEQDLSELYDI